MIVQKSRLALGRGEARVVAAVHSECGHFEPFDLAIGAPAAYAGWLDRSGNPFVPMLLQLAGVLGERLCLEGTVSPRLMENAGKAGELHRSWWGIQPVSIEAEARSQGRRPGAGSALFFTRGVDSWYSALHAGADGPFSHLLYVPELDRQYSAGTRKRALERSRQAAEGLRMPLVAVSCNARELLDRFVDWECSHGGVLAGIGLALGHGLASVSLSSSVDAGRTVPWGSHPELDPHWSTERTTIRHVGAEVTRTSKVIAIACSGLAISNLKVCWREDIEDNCGRCEKCLRTLCALAIAGVPGKAASFRVELTPQALEDLPRFEESEMATVPGALWDELCEQFPDRLDLTDLRAAALQRLPDRRARPAESSSPRPPAITIEAPPDAAASLLPTEASELLPVPVRTRADGPRDDACGHLAIGWTAPGTGSIPLPLRPTARMGQEILGACVDASDRPNPWCLIGHASREAAGLVLRLTESWGQGIACLTRSEQFRREPRDPTFGADRIQRSSKVRVWWGRGDYLDPFLVLESLRHGCLPIQCVTPADFETLAERLPDGLTRFTLAIPDDGSVPRLGEEERAARLDAGLSVMLAGTLERDLARALVSCQSS